MHSYSTIVHISIPLDNQEALCCVIQHMYYEFLVRVLTNYPGLSVPVNTFTRVTDIRNSIVTVLIHDCTEQMECSKDNLVCELRFVQYENKWEYLASDGYLQVLEYAEEHQ